MSKIRWAAWVFILLCTTGIGEVWAAGRVRMPENHPWADLFVMNAWSRDGHVSIAVCNISDEERFIKVAVGTAGKEERVLASTMLALGRRTLKLVTFPVIRWKTAQGDLQSADTVFVYAEIDDFKALLKRQTIQQVKVQDRFPELTQFLLSRNAKAVFRYSVHTDSAMTIVFIPKSIVANQYFLSGRPISDKAQLLRKSDIEKLDVPAPYQKEMVKRLKENHAFLFSRGTMGSIAVVYDVENMAACMRVNIPVYTYVFYIDGSVTAGGGQGLALMIYDPVDIEIQSAVNLTMETEGKKNAKGTQ